jgi:hypothetical protein
MERIVVESISEYECECEQRGVSEASLVGGDEEKGRERKYEPFCCANRMLLSCEMLCTASTLLAHPIIRLVSTATAPVTQRSWSRVITPTCPCE